MLGYVNISITRLLIMAVTDFDNRKGLDFPIVDSDIHTAYRTEAIREKIASHLEEPYKTQLTRETINYGAYPRDSFNKEPVDTGDDTGPSVVRGPDDVQESLVDDMGIDVAILNSLQKLDVIPSTERATREMRAINDVFIEHFLDGNKNFYGLLMISTQRPEAAAEEIDRLAGEDQIVGGLILNGPSAKPLGHEQYDIIYEAAEDNNLPMAFHTSAIGYALNRKFPFLFNDMENYAGLHTLSHPYANMATLTSLIMDGTVEKFPDLDFVFLEQDLGIVPLMMQRMNREAMEKAHDLPLLQKSPEEYLRERFYFGTQPLPEPQDIRHARSLIDIVGPDNLLFATDHPHPDFDEPEWVANKYFGHLDTEDQAKVFGGNAADVFGIDI